MELQAILHLTIMCLVTSTQFISYM